MTGINQAECGNFFILELSSAFVEFNVRQMIITFQKSINDTNKNKVTFPEKKQENIYAIIEINVPYSTDKGVYTQKSFASFRK